ncbi:MAG: gephyrin-like molybdotransferase Glp [Pseudomonadales bacterium]
MLDFDTAFARLAASVLQFTAQEEIVLHAAGGRIVAASLNAPHAAPAFANSAMDGYAVRAQDVRAGVVLQVSQRIAAGQEATPLASGTAARIFTGAMLPAGADAVILQEDAEQLNSTGQQNNSVAFSLTVAPGANVRPAGEDFAAGACLVERGSMLNAASIGRLAAAGFSCVPVHRRPRVAFFSTGDELVEPGQVLAGAQVYNSNRYALYQQLLGVGAEPQDLGRCPDQPAATRDFLQRAAQVADCVISTGGMSVGEEDHVRAAASQLGDIDFWKIAIKPGKPLAFGRIGETAFFGLPGNPVSSFVTFQLLVRPWLQKYAGALQWQHRAFRARADFDEENSGGRMHCLRCTLGAGDTGELFVQRYPNQGSGVMSSLVASNALLPVPPCSSISRGELVEVLPLDRGFGLAGGSPWPPRPAA